MFLLFFGTLSPKIKEKTGVFMLAKGGLKSFENQRVQIFCQLRRNRGKYASSSTNMR